MGIHRARSFTIVLMFLLGTSICIGRILGAVSSGERTPVLVELFTSEGCSSCPPADQFLARLVEQQPVTGVEIIAMSEHVDYWNRLGWQDPFSAAQFSDRQNEYARTFGRSDVFTPQLIVDGQTEFIGGDANTVIRAMSQAAQKRKSSVTITQVRAEGETAKLRVHVGPVEGLSQGEVADVHLALTENNLESKVIRGENQGRTLRHVGVVRHLDTIGQIDSKANSFLADPVVTVQPQWKTSEMRIIVFAQSRKNRKIMAVASAPLKSALAGAYFEAVETRH